MYNRSNQQNSIFKSQQLPKNNNLISIENQQFAPQKSQQYKKSIKNKSERYQSSAQKSKKQSLGNSQSSRLIQDDFTKYPSYNPFNPQLSYLQYSQKLEDDFQKSKELNRYVVVDPNHPSSASNQKPVTYFFDKENLTKQENTYVNMLRAQNGQNLREETKFIDFMEQLEAVREKSDNKLLSMKSELQKTEKNINLTKNVHYQRQLLKHEKPSKMDFLIHQADQIKNKDEKKKHLEQLIRVYPAKNIIKNVKHYDTKKMLNLIIQEIQTAKRMKDKPVKYLYNKFKMPESLEKPLMVPIFNTSAKQREHKPIDFSKPISIDFFNPDNLEQQNSQQSTNRVSNEQGSQELNQDPHPQQNEKKDLVVWDKYGFKIRKQIKAVPIKKRTKKINLDQLIQQKIQQQQQQSQQDRPLSQQNSSRSPRVLSPNIHNKRQSILKSNPKVQSLQQQQQQNQTKKHIQFQIQDQNTSNQQLQYQQQQIQKRPVKQNNYFQNDGINPKEKMNDFLQAIGDEQDGSDYENGKEEFQNTMGNIQRQYDKVRQDYEDTRPGADIDKQILLDTQTELNNRFKQK